MLFRSLATENLETRDFAINFSDLFRELSPKLLLEENQGRISFQILKEYFLLLIRTEMDLEMLRFKMDP